MFGDQMTTNKRLARRQSNNTKHCKLEVMSLSQRKAGNRDTAETTKCPQASAVIEKHKSRSSAIAISVVKPQSVGTGRLLQPEEQQDSGVAHSEDAHEDRSNSSDSGDDSASGSDSEDECKGSSIYAAIGKRSRTRSWRLSDYQVEMHARKYRRKCDLKQAEAAAPSPQSAGHVTRGQGSSLPLGVFPRQRRTSAIVHQHQMMNGFKMQRLAQQCLGDTPQPASSQQLLSLLSFAPKQQLCREGIAGDTAGELCKDCQRRQKCRNSLPGDAEQPGPCVCSRQAEVEGEGVARKGSVVDSTSGDEGRCSQAGASTVVIDALKAAVSGVGMGAVGCTGDVLMAEVLTGYNRWLAAGHGEDVQLGYVGAEGVRPLGMAGGVASIPTEFHNTKSKSAAPEKISCAATPLLPPVKPGRRLKSKCAPPLPSIRRAMAAKR